MEILEINRKWHWPTVAVFLGMLYNPYPNNLTTPENCFTALTTGAVLSMILFLKYPEERKYWLLSLFCAAGVSITKFEGWLVAIFIFMGLIYAQREFLKKHLHRAGAFLLVPVLPGLWMLWVTKKGFVTSVMQLHTGVTLDKVLLLAQLNLERVFLDPNNFFYVIIFMHGLFISVKNSWTKTERFIGSVVFLLILFSSSAFLGLSEDEMREGFKECSHRLLSHATPLLALLYLNRIEPFLNKIKKY
jgi:hypothetical protein